MFTSKGYSICRNDDCDEAAVAGRHGHRRCREHHRELQKAQRRRRRERFDDGLPERIEGDDA